MDVWYEVGPKGSPCKEERPDHSSIQLLSKRWTSLWLVGLPRRGWSLNHVPQQTEVLSGVVVGRRWRTRDRNGGLLSVRVQSKACGVNASLYGAVDMVLWVTSATGWFPAFPCSYLIVLR